MSPQLYCVTVYTCSFLPCNETHVHLLNVGSTFILQLLLCLLINSKSFCFVSSSNHSHLIRRISIAFLLCKAANTSSPRISLLKSSSNSGKSIRKILQSYE